MTDSPSPRSRGGQPGNQNALKHGFYTRHLPGLKNVALDQLDTEFPGLEEEIFVLRAYIRRLLQSSGSTNSYQDFMGLFRTLCMGLSTLARLTREHRAMAAQPVDTLAALRQARTGVAEMQPPKGCFDDFFEEFDALFPDNRPEDYFDEVEGRLPNDTFDGPEQQPAPTPGSQVDLRPAYAQTYDGIPSDPLTFKKPSASPSVEISTGHAAASRGPQPQPTVPSAAPPAPAPALPQQYTFPIPVGFLNLDSVRLHEPSERLDYEEDFGHPTRHKKRDRF